MAKSYALKDEREYPEYEHREYPKHLGFDEAGVDIVVANEAEEIERLDHVVWPKLLGKDKSGKDVVAMFPHEEVWKSKLVVAQPAWMTGPEPAKPEVPKADGDKTDSAAV
jgi:hypothetical protein